MRKIIASMDIGSNSIKLIVAEIIKNKTNVLAIAENPSKGVSKGVVTNPEELTLVLRDTLKKAEDVLGLPIKKLLVTVPSYDAEFILSEGSTTITNEDKIVKGVDIVRTMQASIYNRVPDGYEIVNITPTSFIINDEYITKKPINMKAEKLNVKTIINIVPKKYIAPIIKCFEALKVEVIDVSFTSFGDYFACKNDKMASLVGAIIDVGDETTTVSIFNKGVLTNTKVIEMGGQNIDNDISFIYKVTKNDARKLKENLGFAHKRMAQSSSKMLVTNKLGEEISVNQYELSEIIMCRLEEILNLAKKQINLLTKKEIHYIIVTGGSSEIPDFDLVVESVFAHNAKIAKIHELGVRNNKFAASLGLLKYYNDKLLLRNKDFSIFDLEEQEELGGNHKKINISDNSVLGKLFGYFFDN